MTMEKKMRKDLDKENLGKRVRTRERTRVSCVLLWLLLLGGVLVSPPSAAKQLRFDKEDKGEKIAFRYTYQDSTKRSEELDFALPLRAIAESEGLLLDNAALDRAASDFLLLEGQETATKYLVALQAGFEAAIASLQTSIATFNGRLGAKVVSVSLKEPQKLQLKLRLSGKNLLDIQVSSLVPGMKFARSMQDFTAIMHADTEAIVAQANKSLPEGLRFVVVKQAGGIQFSLKNERRAYNTGTRARANQTVSKTNARLRTRLARHKRDLEEIDKFVEGTKERTRTLITEMAQRLSLARKALLVDMKANKSQFYAAHYLLPSKQDENRTLIDYARVAAEAQARLLPVARAFRSSFKGKNEREQVAEVLSFFQSIPYNDLTQGKVRGFIGFSPPIEMIAQNLGDCDSKSTAMMGLLALLQKDRSVAIFLVPKHAFLGVEMEPREGDARHTYQGKTYVLMEPTGPNVRPIGSLLKISREHLQAGRIDDIVILSPR